LSVEIDEIVRHVYLIAVLKAMHMKRNTIIASSILSSVALGAAIMYWRQRKQNAKQESELEMNQPLEKQRVGKHLTNVFKSAKMASRRNTEHVL
jgi:hypothetical protein